MTRSLLIVCLCVCVAGVFAGDVFAGDFEESVRDLGDQTKRPAAIEKLANAGGDAFDDLLAGLKEAPDAEGVSATDANVISARRLECARLLGALEDKRASADLLQLLEGQAVESPKYPWFGAACANALGRLWSAKEADADRTEVARILKQHAANDKLNTFLRWGCLHGLAAMREGGDEAAAIITSEQPELLRSAAIEVVVAAKRAGSRDDLLNLWENQRFGPKAEDGSRKKDHVFKDAAKPFGLQALFGLGEMGDTRAVAGLVDVCTLNDFAQMASLRDHAVSQMKSAALTAESITQLVATFKDVDKPLQRTRAAQTLGDLGSAGVTGFLDVADDEAPKPKEGEAADKYPADYYAKQVDLHLSNLRSDEALAAFVEAYGKLPAESKSLREKIIDHLLGNRNTLKGNSVNIFRTAADDEGLEAPKRASAVDAWAKAKGKEAFNDLSRWAKNPDGVIRAQAVQNLGQTGIALSKSLPLLKEALADKGENFSKARENALQGLQRSDEKDLLPLFIDSLDPAKETSSEVRNAALKAIDVYRRNARVQDEDVYPAVKARTGDSDEFVRATAVGKAANMAFLMGNKSEAVEIVNKALDDNSAEVRTQAYQQVSTMAADIDAEKLRRAALLEDKPEMKGHAVNALAKLPDGGFGTDTEQQKRLVDLALGAITDRAREAAARQLIGKLGKGSLFTYTSDKLRAQIEELKGGQRPEHQRIATLVRTLIEIQDDTYFSTVQELAATVNVELRRACVEYIKTFGTKKDVDFLRSLSNRTDAAAAGSKADIDAAITALQDRQ